MLRASGEKKHTAQSEAEARVRATIAELQNHEWFKTAFQHMTDEQRRKFFDSLEQADHRATNNFS
jgi:hypothetical protein